MQEKIDPREVLLYLNELGYTNISAHQLKEFIKDLKKVMKYDFRYGGTSIRFNESQSQNIDHTDYMGDRSANSSSNVYQTSDINKENDKNMNKEDGQRVRNLNLNPKTQAHISGQEEIKKEQHIAVHIFENRNRNMVQHEHCIHTDNVKAINTNSDNLKLRITRTTGTESSTVPVSTETTIRSIPPCSTRELLPHAPAEASTQTGKYLKYKGSFIRPAISRPCINKCDPVALYHYYQSEWKKTKIPGQDSRDDLRWAIRARMLSGPRVEVKSKCNIPTCGWSR